MGAMAIGVYPGSFDPLTTAHLAIADAAIARFDLDRLDLVLSNVALAKEDRLQAPPRARVRAIERAAAGRAVRRLGTGTSFRAAILVAAAGLPLLVLPKLFAVLAGLVLVGAGTFFAQAIATGFVGQAATAGRTAASGLYLASSFLGGLVASFVLGQIFDGLGWSACVVAIGASLAVAALLSLRLHAVPARGPVAEFQ